MRTRPLGRRAGVTTIPRIWVRSERVTAQVGEQWPPPIVQPPHPVVLRCRRPKSETPRAVDAAVIGELTGTLHRQFGSVATRSGPGVAHSRRAAAVGTALRSVPRFSVLQSVSLPTCRHWHVAAAGSRVVHPLHHVLVVQSTPVTHAGSALFTLLTARMTVLTSAVGRLRSPSSDG